MTRVRQKFEAIVECTVYKDQEDGCADEPYPVEAGTVLWAAVDDGESRILNGQSVQAVLFDGRRFTNVVLDAESRVYPFREKTLNVSVFPQETQIGGCDD